MSSDPQNAPTQNGVSPEKLMRYTWGYAPPLIMEAAVRTGIFDELNSGSKTAGQVSTATGASLRGVNSIMNALVGLELLEKNSDSYSLTPESRAFLVKGAPGYLGGMIGHISSQLIPKWLDIENIVRTGRPTKLVNNPVDGSAFFEKFVSALFPFNYGAASAAAGPLGVADATGPVRLLDLAAGSGVWGIAIAQKSPHVTVTAVDWPAVLEITKKTAAQFGLTERFSFIPGDLGEVDFGSGYHIATLGHILHSEGVERGKALIRKTYDALAPGGAIVIAEFLVDPERKANTMGLIFDVNMLVNTENGGTYSFEEIREWLSEAGFVKAGLVPAPGASPLIIADKP